LIVSCGAIKSPHLLLLPGIGPKEELKEHGIECHLDAPQPSGKRCWCSNMVEPTFIVHHDRDTPLFAKTDTQLAWIASVNILEDTLTKNLVLEDSHALRKSRVQLIITI
jgi:hypothetical protein